MLPITAIALGLRRDLRRGRHLDAQAGRSGRRLAAPDQRSTGRAVPALPPHRTSGPDTRKRHAMRPRCVRAGRRPSAMAARARRVRSARAASLGRVAGPRRGPRARVMPPRSPRRARRPRPHRRAAAGPPARPAADARSWATLGLAYVEQARITGDPTYYPRPRARSTGRSAAARRQQPGARRAGRAGRGPARLRRRSAAGARRWRSTRTRSGALSIRVDALTELGRYDAARRRWRRPTASPSMQVFARYSYAEELRGRTARAEALLRRALDGAYQPGRPGVPAVVARRPRAPRRATRPGRCPLRQALRPTRPTCPPWSAQARLAVARGDIESCDPPLASASSQRAAPRPTCSSSARSTRRAGDRRRRPSAVPGARATMRVAGRSGVSTDLETPATSGRPWHAARGPGAARSAWEQAPSIWSADALGWALHRRRTRPAALRASRTATRLGTPDADAVGAPRSRRGRARAGTPPRRPTCARGLAHDPALNPWQVRRRSALLDRLEGHDEHRRLRGSHGSAARWPSWPSVVLLPAASRAPRTRWATSPSTTTPGCWSAPTTLRSITSSTSPRSRPPSSATGRRPACAGRGQCADVVGGLCSRRGGSTSRPRVTHSAARLGDGQYGAGGAPGGVPAAWRLRPA